MTVTVKVKVVTPTLCMEDMADHAIEVAPIDKTRDKGNDEKLLNIRRFSTQLYSSSTFHVVPLNQNSLSRLSESLHLQKSAFIYTIVFKIVGL